MTYTDIGGGTYRIKLTPGPLSKQVTITSEGRDSASKETRAIKEVVQNQTIYAPLIVGRQYHMGPRVGSFVGSGHFTREYYVA